MPNILKKKVNSSTIDVVEYNTEKKELTITFLTGAKYSYNNVEFKIYQGLIRAPSAGKYMWREIRNKYTTKKVK